MDSSFFFTPTTEADVMAVMESEGFVGNTEPGPGAERGDVVRKRLQKRFFFSFFSSLFLSLTLHLFPFSFSILLL